MPAGYIDEVTRQKLEQLRDAADEAVWARDLAIMEAVDKGISLRTIGRIMGMAHTVVRDIAGRTRDKKAGREPRRGRYPTGGFSDPSEFPDL